MTHAFIKPLALATFASVVLAACSSSADNTSDTADLTAVDPTTASVATADLTVAAAFYPLQYVAQRVGGDGVTVTSLTPSGVEPHDIELSPATVLSLSDTDLVLYINNFQPAVEDAISTTGVNSFDAASVVTLSAADEDDHADEGADDHAHDEADGHDHAHDEAADDHAHDEAADDHADEADGHDHGGSDPHFWLEPALLAQYAIAVGDEFAALDPDHASTYTANAAELSAELNVLDSEFVTGLANCERTDIVTSHDAFGYLARAYGLHQEGIAGIEPDTEPSPARLLEIKDIIEQTGATTVFTEALVSPKVANAVAQDTGVATAVLDPIESVADGDDYPGVMLRNLDALRNALGCA